MNEIVDEASSIMHRTSSERKKRLTFKTAARATRFVLDYYSRFDKKAWDPAGTGQGYLEAPCTVQVHDFGVTSSGNRVYAINGVMQTGIQPTSLPTDQLQEYTSVTKLREDIPVLDKRPEWSITRWIDVDGTNGDVIQYLLSIVHCDKHAIFELIVNRKQASMGLVLETDDDKKMNYLLTSKCPSLTEAAKSAQIADSEGKESTLYNLQTADNKVHDMVSYEGISYVLSVDCKTKEGNKDEPQSPGTVISFQEGREGDEFGDIRLDLRSEMSVVRNRGAAHLLLELVRAASYSMASIDNYMERALDQLQEKMSNDPDNLHLNLCARTVERECLTLSRTVTPFAETISEIISVGDALIEVMGRSKAGWTNLYCQLKRLNTNVATEKIRASGCIEVYKDRQASREEERQKQIESSSLTMGFVLSIFSPLAFISGIYGMNFVKPDGTPGMPELEWYGSSTPDENSISRQTGITGYGFFWILASSSVVLVTILHAYLGLLSFNVRRAPKLPEVFEGLLPGSKPKVSSQPAEVKTRIGRTASQTQVGLGQETELD